MVSGSERAVGGLVWNLLGRPRDAYARERRFAGALAIVGSVTGCVLAWLNAIYRPVFVLPGLVAGSFAIAVLGAVRYVRSRREWLQAIERGEIDQR
jgi:hypothetical protein